MTDKTLMIAALAVGAFLLTSRANAGQGMARGQVGTQAQRFFANGNQSPSRAGSSLANGQAQIYGAAGGLIGKLLGNLGGGGSSLTGAEYSRMGTSPDMRAEGIAYTGNGNVYDQAAASIPKNPFGLYPDSNAVNPPYSGGFDYSANISNNGWGEG